MVDKWMDPKWKQTSERNKNNKSTSLENTAHHTVGSVSMAKRRKEMLEEDGIEPNSTKCWRAFHMKNDGTWTSEKAKVINDKIENAKLIAANEDLEIDELEVYLEATGKPNHGRVIGMGAGIKAKNFYRSIKDSGSYTHVNRMNVQSEVKELQEELKELKSEQAKEQEELKNMREEVTELRELMKKFIPRSHLSTSLRLGNVQSREEVEESS